MSTATQKDDLRIFVRNPRTGEGAWIGLQDYESDLRDESVLMDRVREYVPAENDFEVVDYEGPFPSTIRGQFPDLDQLVQFARFFYKRRDRDEALAFAQYVEYVEDLNYAVENFDEAFLSVYESEEDFAWQRFDDNIGVNIPDKRTRREVEKYFDIDAYAHTLFHDAFTKFSVPGGVAVFFAHI